MPRPRKLVFLTLEYGNDGKVHVCIRARNRWHDAKCAYASTKIECHVCGSIFSRGGLYRHMLIHDIYSRSDVKVRNGKTEPTGNSWKDGILDYPFW